MTRMSRRHFIAGPLVAAAYCASAASADQAGGAVLSDEAMIEIAELKPGQFTWHPERAPNGPVSIIVSLPQQRVHVYRNGVQIAVSTCSTGKRGHETPTGVFVVLQKDKHHTSSTYDDAPMPNMNRLTWSGIALHAGKLPGYPASHGCVRLPMRFSELLFSVTHMGTPVIIAGSHTDPWMLTHPGMVLNAYAEHEFEHVLAGLDGKKHPSDWDAAARAPVVSVIASSADRAIELIENDRIVARSPMTLRGEGPLGSHVFALRGAESSANGMGWVGIGHHADDGASIAQDQDIIRRISADDAFVAAMKARMHPGLVLVLTDAPLSPDSRTGADFVIVTS